MKKMHYISVGYKHEIGLYCLMCLKKMFLNLFVILFCYSIGNNLT